MAGKGSTRRPTTITKKEWDDRHDGINWPSKKQCHKKTGSDIAITERTRDYQMESKTNDK